MEEYRWGSSVVWKFFLYISLEDVVLSVYQLNYLQVVFCAVAYYGMYWYLDQTEDLYSASRPSQMILSRL